MKLIRVNYQILPRCWIFGRQGQSGSGASEEDWFPPCDVGGDPKRNLVASDSETYGDVDGILADCDIVLERTYHTKAFNQAMMEPFTTYADFDRYGRLHIISSTQIVFHTRRILSRALGIPKSKIRVEKPRIGGGFGAKQTAVCEVYPAFVAMKTGRPAMICYTREEAQIAGSPRHEMEITVKLGATKEGKIRVMDLYTLSNSGAYGEHGPTLLGFPVINRFLCTPALWKHTALAMMSFTPTIRLPVPTVAMVQHRVSLLWNPSSVSWQSSWEWMPPKSVIKI